MGHISRNNALASLKKVAPYDWQPYQCRPDHWEWHAYLSDGQGSSSIRVEAALYPDGRHGIAIACIELDETLAHGEYSTTWECAWESAAEDLRERTMASVSAMHDLFFYRQA